jgi:hypothetical protein
MKITGHKTLAGFHRYNTVDIEDARSANLKLVASLGQEQPQGMSDASCAEAPNVLPYRSRTEKGAA